MDDRLRDRAEERAQDEQIADRARERRFDHAPMSAEQLHADRMQREARGDAMLRAADGMSAEWWKAEADRYLRLHIKAHQRLVELEARLRSYGLSPDPDVASWNRDAALAGERARRGIDRPKALIWLLALVIVILFWGTFLIVALS